MTDTVRIVAAVPGALRAEAEAAIRPLLVSDPDPGRHEFAVPLGPPGGTAVTHYGLSAGGVPAGGETVAALPALVAALPGTEARAIAEGEYDYARDWTGWLAGLGLGPRWPATI